MTSHLLVTLATRCALAQTCALEQGILAETLLHGQHRPLHVTFARVGICICEQVELFEFLGHDVGQPDGEAAY